MPLSTAIGCGRHLGEVNHPSSMYNQLSATVTSGEYWLGLTLNSEGCEMRKVAGSRLCTDTGSFTLSDT